ncbi:hypothetical protein NFI96_029075 [Prochilodus magdalenae]|nr:hypothetical protein NFI96_029075 [Prochilodus magdalenae]
MPHRNRQETKLQVVRRNFHLRDTAPSIAMAGSSVRVMTGLSVPYRTRVTFLLTCLVIAAAAELQVYKTETCPRNDKEDETLQTSEEVVLHKDSAYACESIVGDKLLEFGVDCLKGKGNLFLFKAEEVGSCGMIVTVFRQLLPSFVAEQSGSGNGECLGVYWNVGRCKATASAVMERTPNLRAAIKSSRNAIHSQTQEPRDSSQECNSCNLWQEARMFADSAVEAGEEAAEMLRDECSF